MRTDKPTEIEGDVAHTRGIASVGGEGARWCVHAWRERQRAVLPPKPPLRLQGPLLCPIQSHYPSPIRLDHSPLLSLSTIPLALQSSWSFWPRNRARHSLLHSRPLLTPCSPPQCLAVDVKDDIRYFLVHYNGWNKKYVILLDTPPNR